MGGYDETRRRSSLCLDGSFRPHTQMSSAYALPLKESFGAPSEAFGSQRRLAAVEDARKAADAEAAYVARRFALVARRLEDDAAGVCAKTSNGQPGYLEVLSMGEAAVPLLLRRLQAPGARPSGSACSARSQQLRLRLAKPQSPKPPMRGSVGASAVDTWRDVASGHSNSFSRVWSASQRSTTGCHNLLARRIGLRVHLTRSATA